MDRHKELRDIVTEARIEEVIKPSYDKEELERVVEESIEEAKENEELFKKDFEEFKKMKESPMDNFKEQLRIRSEIITNRDISMKSEARILDVAENNNKAIKGAKEVIDSVDNKFNKVIAALFVIFFLLGVITGVMDEVWKPYLADLLSIAKTSSNIIR